MQTVIASDGRTTYSLIYHLAGAMNLIQRSGWPYVTIGASDGRNNTQTSLYSGTEQAYTIDKLEGNTGRFSGVGDGILKRFKITTEVRGWLDNAPD